MQSSSTPTTIAFLHSSTLAIASVNAMAKALAPAAKIVHVVREDLACAVSSRGVDAVIAMRVLEALQQLADNGAQIIVCTCPVLGAIIEQGAQALREDVGVPVFGPRMGAEAALRLAAA